MEIIVNPERREWEKLTRRTLPDDPQVEKRVGEIIGRVAAGGDRALREITAQIDGAAPERLEVTREEMAEAERSVSPELKKAIATAAENIGKFHRAQMSAEVDIETMPGVRCVQRTIPIQRVGLYIPGGSAPLFSTVLMLAIPAQLAGCPEVVLCTPPSKDGTIAPEIIYAAALCGIEKIYKAGGAQAIAAMAYGTESIPRVDKIFGPGNRYVTKAKQLVSLSQAAIDMPAGPSEVMILADGTARADFVAADMLSQAEHGGDSQAILLTGSRAFAEQVVQNVAAQLERLKRADTARQALSNSRIIVLDSPQELVAFANAYAAEHLIISMERPWDVASRITAAGSIFIGNYSPESAGDYASGTNHTLPTAGWAHSYSGVNMDSFVRKVTIQELTQEGMERLGGAIIEMAEAEGLDAHANAVRVRLGKQPQE